MNTSLLIKIKEDGMFYRVRYNIKFLKTETVDEQSLSFFDFNKELKEHCITRLLIDVLGIINEKIRYSGLNFRQDTDFAFKYNTTETPEQDYDVDVFFYTNSEITNYFDMYTTDFTFHAVKSGIFEDFDDNIFSQEHRIFIKVNPNNLIENFIQEKGIGKIHNRSHDEEILINWILETFKECIYVHEFIENANGLTPGILYENDMDPYDFSLGIGIFSEVNQIIQKYKFMSISDLKNGILYDYMEDRVTAKAKALFQKSSSDLYKLTTWNETLDWLDRETSKYLDLKRYELINLFTDEK